MFIALGMFYPAVTNGVERVDTANQDVHDTALTRQNTAINITRAEWIVTGASQQLTIEVENTGASELTVNATDILVDDTYITHDEIATNGGSTEAVEGDSSTNLWLPGETYTIEIDNDLIDGGPPDRVKIVTGPGVADSREVA